MIVDFNQISLKSRIWVFHSNQSFIPSTVVQISNLLNSFCNNWTSHKKKIKSSFKIIDELFIVVAVDSSSNEVSGCSIDTMYNCIRNIEEDFFCNLTERSNFTYYKNKQRFCCHKNEIKKLYSSGLIRDETKVVNTLVTTIEEFQNNWHIPFKDSWAYNLVSE